MPSGLDGNPNPLRTPARRHVVTEVAAALDRHATRAITLVAIDGIDGAGKSALADELAVGLEGLGRAVIRATIDSFHNPRAVRRQLGATSPLGFYRDSHDLVALKANLLDPLRASPGSQYRGAVFDEPSDTAIEAPLERAAEGAILLFDGIFLHRPELRDYWDVSVYLDGERRVAEERTARAVAGGPGGGPVGLWHLARWCARLDRYVNGQRIYLVDCGPAERADIVVDNNDLTAPSIVRQME